MSGIPATLPEPDELRDCPFCGQEGPYKDDDTLGRRWVVCCACGARGPMAEDLSTARALWNAGRAARKWFWSKP
jgi:Lar family restriction alleviation protein